MVDGEETVKNWIYRIHGCVSKRKREREYGGGREFWGEVSDQTLAEYRWCRSRSQMVGVTHVISDGRERATHHDVVFVAHPRTHRRAISPVGMSECRDRRESRDRRDD